MNNPKRQVELTVLVQSLLLAACIVAWWLATR